MGQPAEPTPSPTRAHTTALDADHTEILVLAVGVLFLVSQLILVILLFAPPSARNKTAEPTRRRSEEGDDDDDDDDGTGDRQIRQRGFRRSRTWGGRSRLAAAQDGHLRQRRRSSGFEMTDLRSPIPSPGTDWDSSSHGSVRSGCRDVGPMAAALAMPMVPQSPRRLRSPLGSPGTESDSSSGNGSARDLGRPPADLSPRSPRVVSIDQATLSAILRGEMDRAEGAETPPFSLAAAQGGRDLAGVFDDPLGVNRRGMGLGPEDERDGDERPRGRKRSDTR